MTSIALVAASVFRESIRDRVPLSIVMFAVLLMAASFLIGQLTAGQDLKIIKDLGLAALSIFGLLIALFIGIGLVSKEVERRSIYALLAKPLSRDQFLVGKYLGLVLTLAVNLGAMTLAFYAALFLIDAVVTESVRAASAAPAVDPRLLVAILLTFGELMIVTALALFFSTFSSPRLSAVLTLGLWLAGHFNDVLRNFAAVVDQPVAVAAARGLSYLLPNLAPFNVRSEVVYGVPVSWSHVALTFGYATVYVVALLLGAMIIFRRRDFK